MYLLDAILKASKRGSLSKSKEDVYAPAFAKYINQLIFHSLKQSDESDQV